MAEGLNHAAAPKQTAMEYMLAGVLRGCGRLLVVECTALLQANVGADLVICMSTVLAFQQSRR